MGVFNWFHASILKIVSRIHRASPYIESDCFFHGPESAINPFRICFECDHIFKTEKELRRAHTDLMREIAPGSWPASILAPTENIWSCPLCTRDW